ncbi:MAG TPA: tRNA dihydrouridine synthase DusB [Planctomycetaceae bacterium]|nr:tRNA dihydrouridine synthase DusB [Planctomycetaceae bacterium]
MESESGPSGPRLAPLRIGPIAVDPPVLQAPMAGFTNWAYRALVRRFGGVGLPATEMVSARGFVEMDRRDAGEPGRLWGVRDEPRPLAVQIWDNDPDTLAEVARRVAHDFRASVVDLNFGCPARDVAQKAESGAYLLDDPPRIGRLVERVVAACGDVPVTAKIRLGPNDDQITAADVAQAVEGAGGAALTVHGRTARQMFRGQADWDRIASLKQFLKRIPLIGNGDLNTPRDVIDVFARHPIDGVMIGRAALGRPWLFARIAAALAGDPIPPEPTPAEQGRLLLEHLDLAVQRFGERKAIVLMRTYACRYGAGQPNIRAFRTDVCRVETIGAFVDAVRRTFPTDA